MDKFDIVEFNDNRFGNNRKKGTVSTIFRKLPDKKYRIHTVIINEQGQEIQKYVTVLEDEIYLIGSSL